MGINYIGECQHTLEAIDKPFSSGTSEGTLRCIHCGCEMLDCDLNRERYTMMEPYTVHSYVLPEMVRQSLNDWEARGEPCGGFLRAVLNNDLAKAVSRADLANLKALPAIVFYVMNRLDARCWGNPEKVDKWEDHNGQAGL